MERYCLYGMSIVSDLAFPQLVKETEEYRLQHPDGCQIEIVKGKIPQDIQERTDVKYEFGDDFSWLVNSTEWKTDYLRVEGRRQGGLSALVSSGMGNVHACFAERNTCNPLQRSGG